MEWKKSKITRWTAGDFRITEDTTESDGYPYRLDSCGADPEYFSDLDMAKRAAELQNRLALVEEDNARLREQLAQRNGVWPAERLPVPEDFDEDNGRGIPTSPTVEEIARELNTVMAANSAGAVTAPRLAYAGEHDYPF